MWSRFTMLSIFAVLLVSTLGCEAPQCKQMRACCAAIEGEEWVGNACGAMVANLHEPSACQSVIHAIGASAEGRSFELPAACGVP